MADTIKTIPSFVQGNTTILAVKPKWEDIDAKGGRTLTDADLTKVSGMAVTVVSTFGKRYEMDYRLIDDNTFSIDLVDLPVGTYGLEVKCVDEGGLKRRFYAAPGEWVRIVSPTSAAEIPTDGTVNGMYDMSIVFSLVGAVADAATEINTAKKKVQEAIVAAKTASDTASKAATDAATTAEKYDAAYKNVTGATTAATDAASKATDAASKATDAASKATDAASKATDTNNSVVSDEHIRQDNEAARVAAEKMRVSNEVSRASAESSRTTEFNTQMVAIRKPIVSTNSSKVAMDANKFYLITIPDINRLTLTLNAPTDETITNDYEGCFDTSNIAPAIVWPANLVWNVTPIIKINKHYEFSIRKEGGKYYSLINEF